MGLYDYIMSNPYNSSSNRAFYDSPTGMPFSVLNNFEPIVNEEQNDEKANEIIWQYQREALLQLHRSVTAHKHQSLNNLFKTGEINKAVNSYDQEETLQKAVEAIYYNIDALYELNKKEGSMQLGKDKNYVRNQALSNLAAALAEIKEKLRMESPIFDQDLQQVQRIVDSLNGPSGQARGWGNFIANIKKFQGRTLEEIGTAWFNQRIPRDLEIRGFSTGAVYYTGGQHDELGEHKITGKYGPKGQLIQDMLLINLNASSLLDDVEVSFYTGSKGKNEKKHTMSIGKFLEFLEKYNEKEQIKIDDDLYSILLEASEIAVQAKSGEDQLPWNKNVSNQIKISDFGDDDHNPTVKRVFILLQELAQLTDAVKTKSPHYNYMANYGLATCLAKFLHMGDLGNQYLLTRDGFVSYYDRILQLHDKHKSIFTLGSRGLALGKGIDTVGTPHNVNFATNSKAFDFGSFRPH